MRSLLIFLIICTSHGIRCGLLTGDFKLRSRPLSINHHHAPIEININTDKLKVPLPSISLPKPAKPPPLSDIFKTSLLSKSSIPKLPSISKFPKISSLPKPRLSILSPLSPLSKLRSPLIPSFLPPPFLPIIPPIIPHLPLLPPVIPPLPLLPVMPPIIPRIPSFTSTGILRPLRVPILGKSPLQKALGSELSPVSVNISEGKKDLVLMKLRKLLKQGSLTTAEFKRFRKLLIS